MLTHPTTPLVQIKLAGIEMTALIDTGSPITLISERIAQQLEYVQWEPTRHSVKSLTGHRLKSMATTKAPLTITNTTVIANCTVHRDAPVDCVIGTSVLRLIGEVTFDFTKRIIKTHEQPNQPNGPPNPYYQVHNINTSEQPEEPPSMSPIHEEVNWHDSFNPSNEESMPELTESDKVPWRLQKSQPS